MNTKAKILLVDDVNLMLELEKSFLHHSLLEVLVARNGEQALEIARRESPDLIFLDLNMPVMDGATCCRRIKADPVLAVIPVVMVTTAGRDADIELCRQAGCDDYLTKPINRKAFLDLGRKYLSAIDRRKPRSLLDTSIIFRFSNLSFTGRGVDISSAGIYIASDHEAMEKQEVEIGLPLTESGSEMLWVSGRVAWTNGSRERRKPSLPTGFGVEFQQLDETSSFVLDQFLSTLNEPE